MKGIKRCRSWERSYALDTPYPHVITRKATPTPRHTYRHYAHRRTPTPDVTNVYLRYPMQPTYAYNVSLPHIPAIWHTPTADATNVSPQRMSTTYPCDISLQRIPATYPYNISLTHIPITYPQYISPTLTTPHPPMDISGNLW